MIKYRYFNYNRIIVLTTQRLKELEALLLKHCDSISYQATTKNEAEIHFDSFEELASFNNHREDKILSLHLNCCSDNKSNFMIKIDFAPKTPFEQYSVRCLYCFSDIDRESIFITDLKKFLGMITVYNTQYLICEWASLFFFLVLGLYPIIIPFGGSTYIQKARGVYPLIMGILLFEAISIGLYFLFSKLIWKKLFPRAIFAWGEESENYSKLKNLRSNLFWGVLVATAISVIIGLIL